MKISSAQPTLVLLNNSRKVGLDSKKTMKKLCLNNQNNEYLLQNNKHKNDTEYHHLFIYLLKVCNYIYG